jgi:uncharacterized protein (TIGR03086 family)
LIEFGSSGEPIAFLGFCTMDIRELDLRALDETEKIVAWAVTPEDLRRPTPCPDWTLHGLLRHMVSENQGFAAAANGVAPDRSVWTGGTLGDDPTRAYLDSAALVRKAFSEEGVLERRIEVREFGVFPAAFAISMHLVDLVIHGWDVARSLGAHHEPDPELAEAVLRTLLRMPLERGPSRAFGALVQVPGDASVTDRLLGHVGRDPRWTP